jgi:hypothetical protein
MLKSIKCPVLVLWVPSDMFHPWGKWKPLTKLIPKVVVEEIKIHPWSSDCAVGAYEKFSN